MPLPWRFDVAALHHSPEFQFYTATYENGDHALRSKQLGDGSLQNRGDPLTNVASIYSKIFLTVVIGPICPILDNTHSARTALL